MNDLERRTIQALESIAASLSKLALLLPPASEPLSKEQVHQLCKVGIEENGSRFNPIMQKPVQKATAVSTPKPSWWSRKNRWRKSQDKF